MTVSDVRLMNQLISLKFISLCDLVQLRHFILQCQRWQAIGDTFLNGIRGIEKASGQRLLTSYYDILFVFLVKCSGYLFDTDKLRYGLWWQKHTT